MAQFSRQLNSGIPVKPAISTNVAPVDVFTPLANAAAGIFGALDAKKSRDADEAKLQADAQEAAKKQRSEDVLDELAGSVFEITTGQPTEVPGFNAAQTREVQDLKRLQSRLGAGAVSSTEYDIRLEKSIASLMRRYPDQRYEVFTALDKLGVDHAIMRQFQLDNATFEAEVDAAKSAVETANTAFLDAGLNPQGLTQSEIQAKGRSILRTQFEFDESVKRAAEARAQRSELRSIASQERAETSDRREQVRFIQSQEDRNVKKAETAVINSRINLLNENINPQIDELSSLIEAHGNSEEGQKLIEEYGQNLLLQLSQVEREGLSSFANQNFENDTGDFTDYINTLRTLVNDATTGDLSDRQQTLRALRAAKTQGELEARDAYPFLTQLRDLGGNSTVANAMGEAVLQNEGLRTQLADEVSGALRMNNSRGVITAISEFSKIKSGEFNYQTLDNDTKAIVAPIANEVNKATMPKMFNDTGINNLNPVYFQETVKILADTSREVPSESMDPRVARNVLERFTNGNFLSAIDASAKANPTGIDSVKRSVLDGVHHSFKKMREGAEVEGLRDVDPLVSTPGGFVNAGKVFWDSEQSKFEFKGNRRQNRPKADLLNKALDTMVKYELETSNPFNLTDQELRDFFVFEGRLPERVRNGETDE